jgi:hypothetical protein
VQSFSIVKMVDVVSHRAGCLFMGLVGSLVHLLRFETFEKAFHRCVVVAIPLSAHTLKELPPLQSIPTGLAGELGAPIAMDD